MAYVLVHEDDWSSYGTDIAAVSNNVGPDYGAYVYWDGIGSNLSGHGTTVGPNSGPNGGPGVKDLATSGGFVGKNISMTCREFKLECLYDFTGWNPSAGNFNQPIFKGWHIHPYGDPDASEFSNTLFEITHNVSGVLTVEMRPNGTVFQDNVVPTSGNVQFRVEGRLSTISGSPGTFSAASDGFLKIYLNDSLVHETTGAEFWHDDATIPSANPDGSFSPYWNTVELGLHGKVGLYRVYADNSCLVTERYLLTGQNHTVTGRDDVIAGYGGTLVGDRSVLLSLDGSTHSENRTGALILWGDFYHNGNLFTGSGAGSELDALGTTDNLSGAPSAGSVTLAGAVPMVTVT